MPSKHSLLALLRGRSARRAGVIVAVAATTLALVSAPAQAAAHDPIGSLDQVSVAMVDSSVTVSGWAADPDGHSRVLKVHISDNGKLVANRNADQPRPDVANAYPTYGPNHGFSTRLATPLGVHEICAVVMNIGAGANNNLGCRTVTIANNPVGAIESTVPAPGGFQVSGYALDPNSTAKVKLHIWVDGHYVAPITASAGHTASATFPNSGANHGFSLFLPVSVGKHTICAWGFNIGAGTANPRLACATVTRVVDPSGAVSTFSRAGSDAVTVTGWAVDPDSTKPISVRVTSDGVLASTVVANLANTAATAAFPGSGNHGFTASIALDGAEHKVCAVAVNVGAGANVALGCKVMASTGSGVPAEPTHLSVIAGSTLVRLNWVTPRSVKAPITSYRITVNPGNRTVTVGNVVTARIEGLKNDTRYKFDVRAVNSIGTGSAISITSVPSYIPPQRTPAPVSTSHYLRNLTGNLTSDAALMRTMGISDAEHNPSGHSYLVLLQVGGQDESRHGALLSAIARYVSYPAVVSALKAYLDGYASKQKAFAPLTLAIGTNNDVDVNASAGASWAVNIVNPILNWTRVHHNGIVIAGADDMEPGFSATVSQTRAWLTGYLHATTAKFVFNGSADGCSTTATGSRCNNGWHMADLQWLSGGASSSRIMSLPQIYNYAMPKQWKNISLTGTAHHLSRLYFAGPLTEVTACDQAGSCGSISNVDAWTQLWAALSSSSSTSQSQMPHGTDLRIN